MRWLSSLVCVLGLFAFSAWQMIKVSPPAIRDRIHADWIGDGPYGNSYDDGVTLVAMKNYQAEGVLKNALLANRRGLPLVSYYDIKGDKCHDRQGENLVYPRTPDDWVVSPFGTSRPLTTFETSCVYTHYPSWTNLFFYLLTSPFDHALYSLRVVAVLINAAALWFFYLFCARLLSPFSAVWAALIYLFSRDMFAFGFSLYYQPFQLLFLMLFLWTSVLPPRISITFLHHTAFVLGALSSPEYIPLMGIVAFYTAMRAKKNPRVLLVGLAVYGLDVVLVSSVYLTQLTFYYHSLTIAIKDLFQVSAARISESNNPLTPVGLLQVAPQYLYFVSLNFLPYPLIGLLILSTVVAGIWQKMKNRPLVSGAVWCFPGLLGGGPLLFIFGFHGTSVNHPHLFYRLVGPFIFFLMGVQVEILQRGLSATHLRMIKLPGSITPLAVIKTIGGLVAMIWCGAGLNADLKRFASFRNPDAPLNASRFLVEIIPLKRKIDWFQFDLRWSLFDHSYRPREDLRHAKERHYRFDQVYDGLQMFFLNPQPLFAVGLVLAGPGHRGEGSCRVLAWSDQGRFEEVQGLGERVRPLIVVSTDGEHEITAERVISFESVMSKRWKIECQLVEEISVAEMVLYQP